MFACALRYTRFRFHSIAMSSFKLRADAPTFQFSGAASASKTAGKAATETGMMHDPRKCYSIDVECVAIGWGDRDRGVARVALVGPDEEVLFDKFVRPDKTVTSYLTPLTGITAKDLDDADSLDVVRGELKQVLPKDAIVVGQSIQHDIDWISLVKGEDFADAYDISSLFATMVSDKNGRSRVIRFSLRHEVLHLRGFEGAGTDIQAGAHSPVTDALFSLRLYHTFVNKGAADMAVARQSLLTAPRTQPFWRTTPYLDGVAMGPAWATPVLDEKQREEQRSA